MLVPVDSWDSIWFPFFGQCFVMYLACLDGKRRNCNSLSSRTVNVELLGTSFFFFHKGYFKEILSMYLPLGSSRAVVYSFCRNWGRKEVGETIYALLISTRPLKVGSLP